MISLASIIAASSIEMMHEHAGRAHRIGRNDANRHDLIGLGDDAIRGESHDRIEIGGGQPIGEIAVVIRLMRAQQREIGAKRLLQQKRLAVDFDDLLALRDDRADAGRRQTRRPGRCRRRECARPACPAE